MDLQKGLLHAIINTETSFGMEYVAICISSMHGTIDEAPFGKYSHNIICNL